MNETQIKRTKKTFYINGKKANFEDMARYFEDIWKGKEPKLRYEQGNNIFIFID